MRFALCIMALLLILSGCTDVGIANDGNIGDAKIVPVPDDIFRYQTFVTLKDGRIEKTTFALLEGKVDVEYFCAGCYAQYFLTFWGISDQVDNYLGDKLEGNRTTDTAVLSKPLYRHPDGEYLDNIWAIVCTDKKGNPIGNYRPYPVSYNPATRELLIDGFQPNHQIYFSVIYFHSLSSYYEVHYSSPGNNTKEGYVYDPRAVDWVTIPYPGNETQVVSPFTIRHVPVILQIPSDADIANGQKFEFFITVTEVNIGNTTAVQSLVGYNQRWLISCR